jgi:hypothetical protein
VSYHCKGQKIEPVKAQSRNCGFKNAGQRELHQQSSQVQTEVSQGTNQIAV